MSPTLSTRAGPSCPADDGTTYTSSTGEEWVIYCTTGFPGDDLTSAGATSFEDCIAACDNYVMNEDSGDGANCVSVTYASKNPNGNKCYRHSRATEVREQKYAWSARRKQYPLNGPAVFTNLQVSKEETSKKVVESPKTTSQQEVQSTPTSTPEPDPEPTTVTVKEDNEDPETSKAPTQPTTAESTKPSPATSSATSTPSPKPSSSSESKEESSTSRPARLAAIETTSTTSSSEPSSSSPSSTSSDLSSHTSTSHSTHRTSNPESTSQALPATATVTTLSTAPSTLSTIPSSSNTSTSSDVLSTGAKIGIGVGLGAIFLLLLALLLLLLRRKRGLQRGEKLADDSSEQSKRGLGRMVREVNPGKPVEMGDLVAGAAVEVYGMQKGGGRRGGGDGEGRGGDAGLVWEKEPARGMHELAGSGVEVREMSAARDSGARWDKVP